MTDKPILFSGPMIRALLDGRKTKTRRVLKPQPPEWVSKMTHEGRYGWIGSGDGHGILMRIPYAPGDRLWVREDCATWEGGHRDVVYRADLWGKDWSDLSEDARNGAPWNRRSSIHMPRWASRLTLTLTDVRVQRVQEISAAGAIAEGCAAYANSATIDCDTPDPRDDFADLWNSIHGPDAWDENPWVRVLTFDVHHCNIDQMPEETT